MACYGTKVRETNDFLIKSYRYDPCLSQSYVIECKRYDKTIIWKFEWDDDREDFLDEYLIPMDYVNTSSNNNIGSIYDVNKAVNKLFSLSKEELEKVGVYDIVKETYGSNIKEFCEKFE